jgi:NADH-quinone oxidoreductase subunit C
MLDLDLLRTHLPEGSFEPAESLDGMTTIYVERERLVETCRALRDTPELGFAVLLDVIPVDYLPREPRYEVTYLLVNLGIEGEPPFDSAQDRPERPKRVAGPQRLRVRVRVPNGDARLPTVSEIWPIANWAEREAYDLFGISIDGHPDLRRILMPDDWEGFPLRKDYPVQIKAPVKTYEPLQVSAEEFAANVQAARSKSSQT